MPPSRRWNRSPANVHLILGGKDKGSDYTLLNDLLRQRVKRVYTIGAAAEKIESQIKGVEVDHSETLETALRRAAATAAAGDIVLLAPACASFDQFQNYEHRGRVFKEVVQDGRRGPLAVNVGASAPLVLLLPGLCPYRPFIVPSSCRCTSEALAPTLVFPEEPR